MMRADIGKHRRRQLGRSLLVTALLSGGLAQAGLVVNEVGGGTPDHTLYIESPGHFRLAAVRAMNYGLSEWYDLANDPDGRLNILHRPDGTEGDQGSLFNQVINPGDLIGHIRNLGNMFQEVPRECVVVEKNAVRVILKTSYYPMLNRGINTNLILQTTYTVYATGRIGVENTMSSLTDQTIDMWRNSTLSFGDPTYHFQPVVKGTGRVEGRRVRDASANWKVNEYAGFQANFPDWVSYEITANTSNEFVIGRRLSGQKEAADGPYTIVSDAAKFGWLRCSDRQSPYCWQSPVSDYLRMYWDPATPAPFTHWTRASIVLVPKPDNPAQGGQSTHGWDRFKRFYYEHGTLHLKAHEGVTQRYLIQLGTGGDSLLPDLTLESAARRVADEYRVPTTLSFAGGSGESPSFDYATACYRMRAVAGKVTFTPDRECDRPVFEISAMPTASPPKVLVDGQPALATASSLQGGRAVVQCLTVIGPKNRVEITGQ